MEYQSLQLVTPPPTLPITLEQAKEHLRIEPDANEEDGLIESFIAAATEFVSGRNGYTGRVLVQQDWRVYFSEFSLRGLEVPFPPLIRVNSITYLDSSGNEQTLSNSVYIVTKTEPAFVKLKSGQSWPEVLNQPDSITIHFTAGYATLDANSPITEYTSGIPASIKAAMLLVIGDLYQNREAQALVQGAEYQPNPSVRALLNPYRANLGI